MLNTLKTVWGFLVRAAEKHTPLSLRSQTVEDTFNYLKIDETLATSGQPTEQQFELIKRAGFKTVVNLAPSSVLENSLKDEPALLAALGLEYVHIPVDFTKPTDADFEQFKNALEARPDTKIWVHCAANMRVSAFIYRYRRTVLGLDEATARPDLKKIWEPFGVWKTFIAAPGSLDE